MVLRAKTVAESLSVDWLSNVPCVSISSTATWRRKHGEATGSLFAGESGLELEFGCEDFS